MARRLESHDDALIAGFCERSLAALQAAAKDAALPRLVGEIAQAIEASMRGGGKLLITGDGGRPPTRGISPPNFSRVIWSTTGRTALALTTDTSFLAAVGNDYGFEHVFRAAGSRVWAAGRSFLAISTSDARRSVCARCNGADPRS